MIELIHSINDTEHTHEFPDDWIFGGPSGTDPRADPRWRATTYTYFDDKLTIVHFTQVPICDDEAIELFTAVANYGPRFNPVWLQATRPNGTVETLPVEYDKSEDVVWENENGQGN